MRLPLVVAVVLVVLSGCTDSGSKDEPSTPTDEGPDEPQVRAESYIPIELDDCAFIEALYPVDAALVQSYVPDDFEVMAVGGQTTIYYGASMCGAGGESSQRGILAITVVPNDPSLEANDDRSYFYEPEQFVANGTEFARSLGDLGIQPWQATVFSMDVGATGGQVVFGNETHQHEVVVTSGPLPPGAAPEAFGSFREYFPAEGGYGYWDATWVGDPAGEAVLAAGTMNTPEGSVAREILGNGNSATTFMMNGLPLAASRVGFVPAPEG